ncbi:MAG: hypothetical protein APF84_12390 [Gracilibacter sp. BRH_c7a]|nr:MAG: hypothetical protein APF84_12390 [Gracilibacter sp. BRH_c7a]
MFKMILLFPIILFILSIIDGILTLWGLRLNIIEEVNPMMKFFIKLSPVVFMAIKIFLSLLLIALLWRIGDRLHKSIIYLLWFSFVVYSLVIIFHIYWIYIAFV